MMRFHQVTLLLSFMIFLVRCQESNENNNKVSDNPPTTSSEWQQVWADEFDGEELDLSKWNVLRWRPGWVNNEQQAYTDRDTNIFLEDGNLVIQGLIEPNYSGTDYTGHQYTSNYTSGRINTDDKFSWTYGRFDIRAKLPGGRGSWPAIWMLGESISSIGWPDCGEIDIMEHVGYDNGNVHGSIHTKDFNHMMNTQKSGSTSLPTVTQSFHTYSLEWSPSYLRFLIDDSPFFFVYNDYNGNQAKWPFDSPHYMILNLAIGGDWGGVQGIASSAFPMTMLVDHVRVSKRSESFGDVKVTFQVDMQNVNVSGTGVWISGGSISSASPGGIQMQPSNSPDLWEAELTMPPNSNFTFKYRNGYFPNSWSEGWEVVSGNCTVGQYSDRSVSIGVADTTLPSVCFNMCAECI